MWLSLLRIAVLVFSAVWFIACDPALTYLGLKNAAAPSAVEIVILCDYGGAPCTPDRLRTVVDAALTQAAPRSGSTIDLYWMGNSVGETALIASVTVPPSRGESLRARHAHHAEIISSGRAVFEEASAAYFTGFHRRKSPILESLGKLAIASKGVAREIWLVSDLLDEGLYRFECGSIPDEASFRQVLASILPPQSLRGARVVAVFAAPDVIAGERCAVSVDRFRRIVSLYETAVAQAGGDFLLSPTNTPLVGGQP